MKCRLMPVAMAMQALLLLGCNRMAVQQQEQRTAAMEQRIEVVRRVVDTTIVVAEADSAMARALLECDSLGNVLMRELEAQQGRQIAASVRLQPTQVDGRTAAVIDFAAHIDTLQRTIRLRDERIAQLESSLVGSVSTRTLPPARSGPIMWALIAALVVGAAIGWNLKPRFL